MATKITWKTATQKYASGQNGFAGKWRVFNICWNSCRSQGSKDPPWVLTCTLPGIKDTVGSFDTQEDAQAKALGVLERWVAGLNEESTI